MKNLNVIVFAVFATLFFSLGQSFAGGTEAPGDAIVGVWLTEEKDAKIEIYKEEGKYYGKLIWGEDIYDAQGRSKLDDKNPDKDLQKRPLKGLLLLKNFHYKNDEWKGGTIYDPENGKTYSCVMELKGNMLKVTGYIGFSWIGRTVKWTRIKKA